MLLRGRDFFFSFFELSSSVSIGDNDDSDERFAVEEVADDDVVVVVAVVVDDAIFDVDVKATLLKSTVSL